MTIRWELYDTRDRFWLFEAACLWLEFDPFEENNRDRAEVKALERLIESKTIVYRHDEDPIKKWQCFSQEGITRPFVKKVIFTSEEINQNIAVVFREELVRVARYCKSRKIMPDKPKFLFPEARDGNSEEGAWEKGGGSKKSYQELLQALLKILNVDPKERDAVGKICQKLQESGSSLSDVTIRKILQEIEPSRQKKQK